MKQVTNPDTLPKPGGAYSIVVRKAGLVFVAGLLGMGTDRKLVGDDIQSQTRRALENLRGAVERVGGTLADVCSVTAYLDNPGRDFAAFNDVYAEFFSTEPPARATVQAGIPGGALIEIQATAVLD